MKFDLLVALAQESRQGHPLRTMNSTKFYVNLSIILILTMVRSVGLTKQLAVSYLAFCIAVKGFFALPTSCQALFPKNDTQKKVY